jgi:hypothetical protein
MQTCATYKVTGRYHSLYVAKKDRVLSFTFDPPAWWLALAKARSEARGVKAQLVKDWAARYKDIAMDEAKIGRALSGERTQIVVAQRLSRMLKIPPPIFVPSTEDEARAILAEMKVQADADAEIRDIKAGVAQDEKSRQSAQLDSGDGRKPKRGRVERAGR